MGKPEKICAVALTVCLVGITGGFGALLLHDIGFTFSVWWCIVPIVCGLFGFLVGGIAAVLATD